MNYQEAFDRWVESQGLDYVVEIKSPFVVCGDEILQFDSIFDAKVSAGKVASDSQKLPVVLNLGSLDEGGLPTVYKLRVSSLLVIPQLDNSSITEVRLRAVSLAPSCVVEDLSDEQVRGFLPLWEESGYSGMDPTAIDRAALIRKLPVSLRGNEGLALLSDKALDLLMTIANSLPEIRGRVFLRHSFRFDYHQLHFFEINPVYLSINENKAVVKFDDFATFEKAALETADRMRQFLEQVESRATTLSKKLLKVIGPTNDDVSRHIAELAIDRIKMEGAR